MNSNENISHDNQEEPHVNENRNTFVKLAAWTLTLSMGAMTFLVLNASKKWI